MKKYRIRQSDEDWYRLETKSLLWPFWRYVSSGEKESMTAKFNALISPPIKESRWI